MEAERSRKRKMIAKCQGKIYSNITRIVKNQLNREKIE